MSKKVKNTTARRSGRPRKAEADKAKYQMIAVRTEDYVRFTDKLSKRGVQLVDAFGEMVDAYPVRN